MGALILSYSFRVGNVWAFGSFSVLKLSGSALNKGRVVNVCTVFVCIFTFTFTLEYGRYVDMKAMDTACI